METFNLLRNIFSSRRKTDFIQNVSATLLLSSFQIFVWKYFQCWSENPRKWCGCDYRNCPVLLIWWIFDIFNEIKPLNVCLLGITFSAVGSGLLWTLTATKNTKSCQKVTFLQPVTGWPSLEILNSLQSMSRHCRPIYNIRLQDSSLYIMFSLKLLTQFNIEYYVQCTLNKDLTWTPSVFSIYLVNFQFVLKFLAAIFDSINWFSEHLDIINNIEILNGSENRPFISDLLICLISCNFLWKYLEVWQFYCR